MIDKFIKIIIELEKNKRYLWCEVIMKSINGKYDLLQLISNPPPNIRERFIIIFRKYFKIQLCDSP